MRSMRLYQELDADQLSLQKQKEIKMHVEKEAATNKGRMADIQSVERRQGHAAREPPVRASLK